jgi:hypothetical protein
MWVPEREKNHDVADAHLTPGTRNLFEEYEYPGLTFAKTWNCEQPEGRC